MTIGHGLFIAKALIWAVIAAGIIGGILFEIGLDRLYIGFFTGCAFVGVLAFFNEEGKGMFY
jgi:hypothetical protein